ncbi:hypothetical protein SLEP1_g41213 [Rubroshorea leprosula]|uniref:Uncharacterized protein n=1 Tax=Rubroshorea leprosula TaxID=152421 RepID=A0AAV5L6P9_9ROSI|nr:hypothetical protein SLEP1_g41213 [Rubroshorea leprosula]
MGLPGGGNGCSKLKEDTAGEDSSVAGGCSTPKGQKFRIPEMLSCPPAAMKPKFCSKRKKSSQIAFYAPTDIELFFYTAFCNHFS